MSTTVYAGIGVDGFLAREADSFDFLSAGEIAGPVGVAPRGGRS